MTPQIAKRDENRVPTLVGVDSIAFTDTTTAAVDATTHELLVKGSLTSGDIEIGAVEIKNSTDDTRATVTSRGLSVFDSVSNSLVNVAYDNIALTVATLTDTWVFKLVAATVATVTITYTDATKATISTVART